MPAMQVRREHVSCGVGAGELVDHRRDASFQARLVSVPAIEDLIAKGDDRMDLSVLVDVRAETVERILIERREQQGERVR